MYLADLDRLLNQTPVVTPGLHPISLAFLHESVRIYESLCNLAWSLDIPKNTLPHRAISLETDVDYVARFPIIRVEHDPFTADLNRVLFDKYEFIASHMLTHENVAKRIVSEAHQFETMVLVLLDGLSYSDCKEWPGTEPCLAAHPTITRVGFPTVIGDPPLARKIFSAGLTKRIGFSYWEREDNSLTNHLFQTITQTITLDSARPNNFKQITDWMISNDLSDTYIQIVRSGLDDYAEGHRTSIPRPAVIGHIRSDLEMILNILERKGKPAVLYAVADHGILWKEDEHPIDVITFSGNRYWKGRSGPGRGRCFEVNRQAFWVLDYFQMGRQWMKNEQGIHGGISFQESIVPFIRWETNSL